MPTDPKSGQTPVKGQEDRAGDPSLKSSGLPPAAGPDLVPKGTEVITVGQPIVQDGHLVDGKLNLVAQPIVLANANNDYDPANPARAKVQEPALSRDPVRREAQKRLADLLKKGPSHPDYNPDEVHRLHYEAAGEPVPSPA